jgi:hypothetical protein
MLSSPRSVLHTPEPPALFSFINEIMSAAWDTLRSGASQLRSNAMDTDVPSMKRSLHEIERISDALRQKAVREADYSSQKTYVKL